jgi:hypothetical protein
MSFTSLAFSGKNERDLVMNEITRQYSEPFIGFASLIKLERNVSALGVAEFAETPSKRINNVTRRLLPAEEGNYWLPRLLRQCVMRPRNCRTAEKRDELASLHIAPFSRRLYPTMSLN